MARVSITSRARPGCNSGQASARKRPAICLSGAGAPHLRRRLHEIRGGAVRHVLIIPPSASMNGVAPDAIVRRPCGIAIATGARIPLGPEGPATVRTPEEVHCTYPRNSRARDFSAGSGARLGPRAARPPDAEGRPYLLRVWSRIPLSFSDASGIPFPVTACRDGDSRREGTTSARWPGPHHPTTRRSSDTLGRTRGDRHAP
jgi:hypothetical protein